MTHSKRNFDFISKAGKKITLTTRAYNFELEEIIKAAFGEDVFDAVQRGESVDITLTSAQVQKYYPQLLDGNVHQVNWKKISYDLLLAVADFFLKFKKNAKLRRLESEKEILALSLMKAEQTISSARKIISPEKSFKNTANT